MQNAEIVLALMAGVVGIVWLAGPLRIPYPVLLVLGGLGAGLIPFVPTMRIDPDAVMLGFLPPILYAAAFDFASEDVRQKWSPIAWLAVPLVLVTIGVVAWVAHVVVGLPWAAAFTLGAILGPTDPVSATSVLKRLGGSDRMATILEGESLVNDGTGLTAFRIAVGVAGGEAFSPGGAALQFAGVAAGGIVLGAAVGWLSVLVRRRLDAPPLEMMVSLITAFGSFAAGEALHVSGILACVVCGFVVGRSAELMAPATRAFIDPFWDAVSFLAETLLFLLVGIAAADVAADEASGALVAQSLLLGAVIIGLRLAWVYGTPLLLPRGPVTGARERFLIGVSGMRGAVSVAAALAVSTDVAARDTILMLTCGTVLVTLVPAGVALPWLVRRLGLAQGEAADRHRAEARLRVAHAGLERAEALARDEEAPEELLARARDAYELRIHRLEHAADAEASDEDRDRADLYRRIRRHLLDAEQDALDELRASGDVQGEALRSVQRELDLEATRLDSA